MGISKTTLLIRSRWSFLFLEFYWECKFHINHFLTSSASKQGDAPQHLADLTIVFVAQKAATHHASYQGLILICKNIVKNNYDN